jgi:hypothetical protein
MNPTASIPLAASTASARVRSDSPSKQAPRLADSDERPASFEDCCARAGVSTNQPRREDAAHAPAEDPVADAASSHEDAGEEAREEASASFGPSIPVATAVVAPVDDVVRPATPSAGPAPQAPAPSAPSAAVPEPAVVESRATPAVEKRPDPADTSRPAAAEKKIDLSSAPTPGGVTPAKADAVARETVPQANETAVVAARIVGAAKNSGSAAKTATSRPVSEGTAEGIKEKTFLTVGGQVVEKPTGDAGTSVAEQGDTMRFSPQNRQRFLGDAYRSRFEASTVNAGEDASLSVGWKGWTNGGGERVSTAAQFSRLGEHLAGSTVPTTHSLAGSSAVARAQFVAPAVTPAPVPSESSYLGPVTAAIERMLTHGQDQLALTVRFDQGGSLSLKLSMQQGTIASQFQTDVPGLEDALRNSWGQFAQDAQGRGWKLGTPTFSAAGGQSDQQGTPRDGRPQDRPAFDSTPGFDLASRAGAQGRAATAATPATVATDTTPARALAHRGWVNWA